jgi:methylglyoxal synthase
MKKIAFIAHHGKKEELMKFFREHVHVFADRELVATAHTAQCLKEEGHKKVEAVPHGPWGGDVIIAAMIAQEQIAAVFFFRNLDSPQAHEADITALLRMCDRYNIPLALNEATAECLIAKFEQYSWAR